MKKFLLILGVVVLILCTAVCSKMPDSTNSNFDSVNPVIWLKSGAVEGNGTEQSPYGDVIDAVKKAKELGSAGAKHITLAENSPAFDIGFEPIDISDIGPRN